MPKRLRAGPSTPLEFQLVVDSRDITTMRTPIGLVRMCTLPQGATNSVAHMVNAMNKVFKDFISDITMPFLDDIPIKGCSDEEKDESKDKDRCRQFVVDHIVTSPPCSPVDSATRPFH